MAAGGRSTAHSLDRISVMESIFFFVLIILSNWTKKIIVSLQKTTLGYPLPTSGQALVPAPASTRRPTKQGGRKHRMPSAVKTS